jgi:hypothetical protein
MAAEKVSSVNIRRILFILAFIQLFAWAFDIAENYYLLKWLKRPNIGDEFTFYHVVVYSKWIMALTGALFAISLHVGLLFKKKN